MRVRSQKPPSAESPLSVRHLAGCGWQVLIDVPYGWHTCRSEQDACYIASGMRSASAVNAGSIGGIEVADELDAVANVAAAALGWSGAQVIIDAAARARAQTPQ